MAKKDNLIEGLVQELWKDVDRERCSRITGLPWEWLSVMMAILAEEFRKDAKNLDIMNLPTRIRFFVFNESTFEYAVVLTAYDGNKTLFNYYISRDHSIMKVWPNS